MKAGVLDQFVAMAGRDDLARAALTLARVEYPALQLDPYLARLDEMGDEIRVRLERLNAAGELSPQSRVAAVNGYLFNERGLAGNRLAYNDPRNSFLNEVLDRGLGIPITLGVVYMEVSRRAGFRVEGVNFPGHFLLMCSGDDDAPGLATPLVLDPFNSGAVLSEEDCSELLEAVAGEDEEFDPGLLVPASPHAILARMLLNLKRSYVGINSFPQARDVTELLIALDPADYTQLRDHGLLSYHLRDYTTALRNLQNYLRLAALAPGSGDEEQAQELEQVREYVKALKKRVAESN